MNTVADILKLDLQEDIQSVINLEDRSQDKIQSEIESYIITGGLGDHLSNFIGQYKSNIKETGVWLSGFYGSGKSYFGKMLGYLLDNPMINGTSARQRFIPRLAGVRNQALIENDIRGLDAVNSKVVFLDIAKQNTDNGLAFTLFTNFIKRLGFRDDRYGFMEYDLFIDDKIEQLHHHSRELFGSEWSEIRKNNRQVARAMRRIYMAMDYSEAEYEETLVTYDDTIQSFSASKLKEELEKYLEKFPGETIVFIFDEASEAINQHKFNLLDLEGLAESLSSISSHVWTIAIAQEKLDDVINNSNTNRTQLNKVTDRFKTKIHLDSTEVDIIIRNRLLLKKEEAHNKLINYYEQNNGQVSDATNLKSQFPTKTNSAEEFATYYPFHKYQFDLLQNFLFSSNALVATQIAARGMIITTFDVLRKELRDRTLYHFATAHDLCTEAQPAPPVHLAKKYADSKSIINNSGIDLDGEKLLKTLHFINEAEIVSATVDNITKTYIEDITSYYQLKPHVEKALDILVESKILLLANNNYKITSNLEGKLLEEMKEYDVELYIKKRELVNYLKSLPLLRQISSIMEDDVTFKFNIQSDQGDEIIPAKNKNLGITVYSLFNINEERHSFIETIKSDTQNSKGLITIVPDNEKFTEIDRLLEEVRRYELMEERYASDDDDTKRKIIREFSTIKDEKEKDLINLIETAYTHGSAIYLYENNILNEDNFKGTVNELQRKLIKNIYTKRLPSQLSENIGAKIVKVDNGELLSQYFSGDEFRFFDTKGNFTGDHLKVVEEISMLLGNKYIDGKSLEEELLGPPWGYTYGTISTTLAALCRAGRLVVKYNDTEFFTYRDHIVHEIFSSSRKFQTARFKSITKKLEAAQKSTIIQTLLDLDFENHTQKKLDWRASDFDAASAITQMAEYFVSSLRTLENTQSDFRSLFKNVSTQQEVLQQFTALTTESNYIEKAEQFIESRESFSTAIKAIIKAEKFIKKNLDKIKGYRHFITSVNTELDKADMKNSNIESATASYREAMKDDVIERFNDIQSTVQVVRDEYFRMMQENAEKMTASFKRIAKEAQQALSDLEGNYPAELNQNARQKLYALLQYSQSRIVEEVRLEYHTECQNSNYSLSDIINYEALAPSKEAEISLIRGEFIKETPREVDKESGKSSPRTVNLAIDRKRMTAGEYRGILMSQIRAMSGMPDEDEVEIILNHDR